MASVEEVLAILRENGGPPPAYCARGPDGEEASRQVFELRFSPCIHSMTASCLFIRAFNRLLVSFLRLPKITMQENFQEAVEPPGSFSFRIEDFVG